MKNVVFVAVVRTDVSEEHAISICDDESKCSSEKSVLTRVTRRHIPRRGNSSLQKQFMLVTTKTWNESRSKPSQDCCELGDEPS
jgi:hypothetical protein